MGAQPVAAAFEPNRWDPLVRPLDAGERAAAATLLAHGMRDTPTSVAVHGDDPVRRLRELEPVFRVQLESAAGLALCVAENDELLGVAGLAPPGACWTREPLRELGALVEGRASPRNAWRFFRWRRAWARDDPAEPHWHLGPVAVLPRLRGAGIGGALMRAACRKVDEAAGALYLETDTERNVRFYGRWGFVVVGGRTVLGRPNWYLRRRQRDERGIGPPT